MWVEHFYQQECIPVGCVPAARRPYACVCFPGGGVSAWSGGGVCLLRGVGGVGWCLLPGGGCLPGWGVSAPGGVCLVWGVSAWSGGVSAPGGGCIPACTEADTLPPPPPLTEFLTHACENITLAQLRCGR